jgi:hypothetical protein
MPVEGRRTKNDSGKHRQLQKKVSRARKIMYRKQLAEMRKTNGRSVQFRDPHEQKKAPGFPGAFLVSAC